MIAIELLSYSPSVAHVDIRMQINVACNGKAGNIVTLWQLVIIEENI